MAYSWSIKCTQPENIHTIKSQQLNIEVDKIIDASNHTCTNTSDLSVFFHSKTSWVHYSV